MVIFHSYVSLPEGKKMEHSKQKLYKLPRVMRLKFVCRQLKLTPFGKPLRIEGGGHHFLEH
jgi:hypothetical protein